MYVSDLLKYTKKDDNSEGKKKKKGGRGITRPIICICNDLYASSLRPLRQVR
jgi:hypothetical protein